MDYVDGVQCVLLKATSQVMVTYSWRDRTMAMESVVARAVVIGYMKVLGWIS